MHIIHTEEVDQLSTTLFMRALEIVRNKLRCNELTSYLLQLMNIPIVQGADNLGPYSNEYLG